MSTQYSFGGETGASHTEDMAGGSGTTGVTGTETNAGGGGSSSGSDYGSDRPTLGSARSDYGDNAYGGSLDKRGLGGKGYDDFAEGREARRSRAQASAQRNARIRQTVRGYGTGLGAANASLMLCLGMGLGAALMYFFDPDQGRRRRALMRDKCVSLSNQTADVFDKTSRDLRNRAQGLIAETSKAVGITGEASNTR